MGNRRKVGKDLSFAVFAPPNCTRIFFDKVPREVIIVVTGNTLDGIADHTARYEEAYRFVPAGHPENNRDQVVAILRQSGMV
jgi:myo-inositol-1-phosphate synthase